MENELKWIFEKNIYELLTTVELTDLAVISLILTLGRLIQRPNDFDRCLLWLFDCSSFLWRKILLHPNWGLRAPSNHCDIYHVHGRCAPQDRSYGRHLDCSWFLVEAQVETNKKKSREKKWKQKKGTKMNSICLMITANACNLQFNWLTVAHYPMYPYWELVSVSPWRA